MTNLVREYVLTKIEQGAQFGQWTLAKQLGQGGSGEVWEARNDRGSACALKILIHGGSGEPYQRFCREIEVLKRLEPSTGIIPLLDSCIPENPRKHRLWYVMPIAIPYMVEAEGKDPYAIAEDFQSLATTLKELHRQGILPKPTSDKEKCVTLSKPG